MNLSAALQSGVYLQQSVTGRVYLRVHDFDYSPDDPLPAALFPADTTPHAGKARYYVSTCMIIEYGRDEARWPSLARRFVLES
jgi:hypothetical protein